MSGKKTIKVGKDEFCAKCMEWREYDEEGKCKVCGKQIKSEGNFKHKESFGEYKYEPEDDSESESEEF
jgi:predicted amidophosphoribosyltransferase